MDSYNCNHGHYGHYICFAEQQYQNSRCGKQPLFKENHSQAKSKLFYLILGIQTV